MHFWPGEIGERMAETIKQERRQQKADDRAFDKWWDDLDEWLRQSGFGYVFDAVVYHKIREISRVAFMAGRESK